MIVFAWIGIAVTSIWGALAALCLAGWARRALRRRESRRRTDREIAAVIASLTDEEVAQWLT